MTTQLQFIVIIVVVITTTTTTTTTISTTTTKASTFAMARPVHRLFSVETNVSVRKVNYFVCAAGG